VLTPRAQATFSDDGRVIFADEGVAANDRRPEFERLVKKLQRTGRGHLIVVTDLTRLFRNSADRQQIDRLLTEGRAHVAAVKENIRTWEEGRSRFDEMADLICLAYEGVGQPELPDGPLAEARVQLVEHYLTDVLARWFELRSVPRSEYEPALFDVRARLLGLIARWGSPDLAPLLAPYLDVAEWNEPRDIPVQVRAFATVAVRNSALEDLHLSDHIEQSDWRVLTMAAAHHFAALAKNQTAATITLDGDPFLGLDAATYPFAHAAFTALASIKLGETATWEMPTAPPRDLPAGDASIKRTDAGQDILHAMDDRISLALSEGIRRACEKEILLGVPSLKHLSRNLQKLFRIVDTVLSHGGVIVTQNVLLGPGEAVRRARLVEYNSVDPKPWWSGRGERQRPGGATTPSRSAPCPCGSGRRYKRCCGQRADGSS
jgi:hypothetical protein